MGSAIFGKPGPISFPCDFLSPLSNRATHSRSRGVGREAKCMARLDALHFFGSNCAPMAAPGLAAKHWGSSLEL